MDRARAQSYHSVRNYLSEGLPIDFGVYINADDIARLLREQYLEFSAFRVSTKPSEFIRISLASGLINSSYSEKVFRNSFSLRNNILRLKNVNEAERLAQVIADFLRKKLLENKERISFETVFSHASKIEFLKQAAEAGYKIYLYFVSTESPEINLFRVKARKAKGGHDVPSDKVVSRYFRSLDLLFEAAQFAYQAFFFDNSKDGSALEMFAHFKVVKGEKKWDPISKKDVPNWFLEYYSSRIPE